MAGRPTEYSEEMCEKIIELMKQGASKYEVALELNICEDSFYSYIKRHPKFAEAVKTGEWFSRGAWEREGRLSLRDKDFNSTLWYMNMKNRHGWKDRNETSHEINASLSDVTERRVRNADEQYRTKVD
jgi:orotate phosphoribosyltransferase-like protein